MRTCYCHISPDRLIRIVREKFIERIPTVLLLEQCTSETEKSQVNTVALLDVPEAEVREMLKADTEFLSHFLDCRRHALQVLRGKLPDLGKHMRHR